MDLALRPPLASGGRGTILDGANFRKSGGRVSLKMNAETDVDADAGRERIERI